MSFARKLARRLSKDTRIAGNLHPNPVKEVMRRRKAAQQRLWLGQQVLSSLLKISGHYVPTPRSLDRYHEEVFVRGTTVSQPGLAPLDEERMYERIRAKVREAIKKAAAQEAAQ